MPGIIRAEGYVPVAAVYDGPKWAKFGEVTIFAVPESQRDEVDPQGLVEEDVVRAAYSEVVGSGKAHALFDPQGQIRDRSDAVAPLERNPLERLLGDSAPILVAIEQYDSADRLPELMQPSWMANDPSTILFSRVVGQDDMRLNRTFKYDF